MIRRSILASIVLAASLSVHFVEPPALHACSCAVLPRESSFANATDVFEGRVVEITQSETLHELNVTLNVVRTWKGAARERMTVRTARGSSICGYPFQARTSYLVYATTANDQSRVHLCSRTAPMSDARAREDVQAMGAGVTPIDVARAAPRS